MPLQRGSKLFPYLGSDAFNKKNRDEYFTFKEKIILYRTKENVTPYLNQALQVAEESDYLRRVEAEKKVGCL